MKPPKLQIPNQKTKHQMTTVELFFHWHSERKDVRENLIILLINQKNYRIVIVLEALSIKKSNQDRGKLNNASTVKSVSNLLAYKLCHSCSHLFCDIFYCLLVTGQFASQVVMNTSQNKNNIVPEIPSVFT